MYFYLGYITSVHALNMRALNIMKLKMKLKKSVLTWSFHCFRLFHLFFKSVTNTRQFVFCNENNIPYLILLRL